MRLNPAHRWKLPAGIEWFPPEGRGIIASKASHWERCHVYPNGDILALCAIRGTPFGLGLAKFDRDSKLLWRRDGPFHHDFDVAEDGRIFALTRKQKDTPPDGFEALSHPFTDDILTILSPAGEVEREVSILEAFKGTPYQLILLTAELTAPKGETAPASTTQVLEMMRVMPNLMPMPAGARESMKDRLAGPPQLKDPASRRSAAMDVLHVNGVRVLGAGPAGKSSPLRPGHVLLSLRTPSLLATLDPEAGRVTWAARGPWRFQHDAQPLADGRILMFDNLGSARGARVFEYEPVTGAAPWAFLGPDTGPVIAPFRGRCQRLANGNTLVVEPMMRAMEVTPGGKAVWEAAFDIKAPHSQRNITGAARYRPKDLPFLKGAPGPRPG
jgi:hypothetical protein